MHKDTAMDGLVSYVDCVEKEGVSDLVECCQGSHPEPLYDVGGMDAKAAFEEHDPGQDLLSVVEQLREKLRSVT